MRIDDSRKNVGSRTSGAFFTRAPTRVYALVVTRITSAGRFDKSKVRDDNMIGGFEEVVTLYRLRRNYLFRDDASGFACRSVLAVLATMRCTRNFGHAS